MGSKEPFFYCIFIIKLLNNKAFTLTHMNLQVIQKILTKFD